MHSGDFLCETLFLDGAIILHLRLMMVIICYLYAVFSFFFLQLQYNLVIILKAFEHLLPIKAVLNYGNESASQHFFASAVAFDPEFLVNLQRTRNTEQTHLNSLYAIM